MKRPYLKTFLLTALMVFGVSQEGNGLSAPPKNLKVEKCPNSKCRDNITPFLKWDQGNNSYFEIQIFFADSSIPSKCGDIITDKSSFCDKSVTAIPYIVPIDILKSHTEYKWRIRALSKDGKEVSNFSETESFETSEICTVGTDGNDMDCDGIPDIVEKEKIGTNPEKKTLFVRPRKQKKGGGFEYWKEFIALFPDDSRPGFAKIPQFEKAGIEVVVIGDPGHKKDHPERIKYERFSLKNYNPADSDDALKVCCLQNDKPALPNGKLPCNIMEIELYKKLENTNYNGHTYLGIINTAINENLEDKHTWSWDVKGNTVRDELEIGGKHYGIPRIYTYPLDMYFEEGAYEEIKIGQPTKENITHCNAPNTSSCKKLSPLNLNDQEKPIPPSSEKPDHTVEFAPFGMDGTGKIVYIPPIFKENESEEHNYYKIDIVKNINITQKTCSTGASVEIVPYNNDPSKIIPIDKENDTVHETVFIDDSDGIVYLKRYTMDDVKRRTIVHEMGHALLIGNDSDHCSNPQCIMYGNTIDWEPHEFGPPYEVDENGKDINYCEHSKGRTRDIGAVGKVYNTPH